MFRSFVGRSLICCCSRCSLDSRNRWY